VKRVTLADVARDAGVSVSAASLAMRGVGRLSDETRERVHRSMHALGYVYHRGAATLRTRRGSVVGLVVTDISNPFFSAMTLGLEEVLGDAGYLTLVTNTFDDPRRQDQLVQAMLEHPVDALAYVPVVGADLAFATEHTAPTRSLALTRRPVIDAPCVAIDDRMGGRLAARHVVEVHGRRRVAYLGGPANASPRHDRLRGILDVLDETDAELAADLPGWTSIAEGARLAAELVGSGVEVDAIICHSDVIAFAATHALRTLGLARLAETSVVGFDGLPESSVFEPAITSVAVGPADVGRLAGRWLLAEIRGENPSWPTPIEPHLQVRRSCGCPPPG
jgi:LacI family transcriptional regulator